MKAVYLILMCTLLLCCYPQLVAEESSHEDPIIEEGMSSEAANVIEETAEISSDVDLSELASDYRGTDDERGPGVGCVWVDAPKIDTNDLKPDLDQDVIDMLPELRWETNLDYRGDGSPDAKKGGRLQYVQSSFPPTLRTCGKNAKSAFQRMVEGLCYEPMLNMDSITYGYAPNLASKWAIADDKVSFFFKIDDDAMWSDGNPVVSNDVVQTWNLYVDPGIEDPFYNNFYESNFYEPVAITDKVFMIRARHLNWRAFMSAGFMTILPGHILENITGEEYLEKFHFDHMPGSGPYEFMGARVNEEIILARREDWWQIDKPRNEGLYNFDRIQFIFLRDANLTKERFKAGDIDWISVNVAREWNQEFTPAMMPEIARGHIQRRKVFTHRPIGVSGLAYNMRVPPFDDIRVRKAVAYLYNREKMMDNLFFNEYEYVDSFYPNSPYENPSIKIRFNPDRAVELLEKAGWKQKNRNRHGWLVKDGKIFDLTLNYIHQSSERIMTILQEDLKDVGIRLNLKQVTWATDIREVGERNFNISSRAYTGILFPNPESSFHSKYADLPNNNNIWGFKNDEVDEILERYPMMFDHLERVEAVRRIDEIVTAEHLYAFGWYGPSTWLLYWNKFGMPDYYLSRTGDERSIVSLWWYCEEKDRKLSEAIRNNTNLEVGEEEVAWWDKHYPQGDDL